MADWSYGNPVNAGESTSIELTSLDVEYGTVLSLNTDWSDAGTISHPHPIHLSGDRTQRPQYHLARFRELLPESQEVAIDFIDHTERGTEELETCVQSYDMGIFESNSQGKDLSSWFRGEWPSSPYGPTTSPFGCVGDELLCAADLFNERIDTEYSATPTPYSRPVIGASQEFGLWLHMPGG